MDPFGIWFGYLVRGKACRFTEQIYFVWRDHYFVIVSAAALPAASAGELRIADLYFQFHLCVSDYLFADRVPDNLGSEAENACKKHRSSGA